MIFVYFQILSICGLFCPLKGRLFYAYETQCTFDDSLITFPQLCIFIIVHHMSLYLIYIHSDFLPYSLSVEFYYPCKKLYHCTEQRDSYIILEHCYPSFPISRILVSLLFTLLKISLICSGASSGKPFNISTVT